MRESVFGLVEVFAGVAPVEEPVLEIGALRVNEEFPQLKLFFYNKEYIATDMREGSGVDRVEDVEKLSFGDNSIGTVIMVDSLEHIRHPFRAMSEIFRVLKPGGVVVMTSTMDAHVHAHPSDYWRFTPEAFKVLLECFNHRLVGFHGNCACPSLVMGVGVKEARGSSEWFVPLIYQYIKRNKGFDLKLRLFSVKVHVKEIWHNLFKDINKIGFEVKK